VKCPVKINTGELIKHIRHENLGTQTRAQKTAMVRSLPCKFVALELCNIGPPPWHLLAFELVCPEYSERTE
jgi:hypothetical protein